MNKTSIRRFQARVLAGLLLTQVFLLPLTAHAESVVITVGQPNVWSLEQAHYLLARIRERNFGLRNKTLDETDLDPNAVNATRLDALRTLFELGVSYDQGLGLTNKLNRRNLESGESRREELFARRAALFDEKSRLLAQNGILNADLKNLEESEANAETIKQKEREINASQQQIDATDKQLANLNAEITLLGAGSSEITSPAAQSGPGSLSGGMGERIGKAITEEFSKEAAKNPRLAATTKLDNYVQMQYELLAKQLTLLRDEVSPRERLIFLELPTSIYATPGRGNEMSAKSVWEVTGYYQENRFAQRIKNLKAQKQNLASLWQAQVTGKGLADRYKRLRNYDTQIREINEQISSAQREFYEDKAEALAQGMTVPFSCPEDEGTGAAVAASQSRVIDLIPRQSSLNVSDLKEVVKEKGFKALFSLLIGIGGSVNYQQRREHFEQFQQQEVYAAGFGKGQSKFGWTFNPMPGTKRLAPGIRTTYAVMVIPRDAVKIELKAAATGFRSVDDLPNLDASKVFKVDVPNGPNDEGFFVTRIDYPHIDINDRSVVVLKGNFSNQTGVLVNGTPLTRTVGVASPWLGSEREMPDVSLGQPDTSVKGHYEVINSNQIILTFLMPLGFKGSPKITLVTPNRARTLNDIKLTINGKGYTSLDDEYRIGKAADDPDIPLTIADLQISPALAPIGPSPRPAYLDAEVNLTLTGVDSGGKAAPLSVYFNASECKSAPAPGGCRLTPLAQRLYHLELKLPFNLERISFTVVQDKKLNTKQIDNPIFARAVASRIAYDMVDEEDGDDDSVTVVLEGKRIEDLIAVADGATVEWQSRSFNQGVIVVTGLSKSVTLVRLMDSRTGEALAPISITRRPPKKKKPAPSSGSGSGHNNDN